jgi:hypothetical protein
MVTLTTSSTAEDVVRWAESKSMTPNEVQSLAKQGINGEGFVLLGDKDLKEMQFTMNARYGSLKQNKRNSSERVCTQPVRVRRLIVLQAARLIKNATSPLARERRGSGSGSGSADLLRNWISTPPRDRARPISSPRYTKRTFAISLPARSPSLALSLS